ncbi:helix-turn-helix transcriptional regulator [Photobacterium rosenbergii]|uniref:Helix-turn-helix transcriptional regulator n=1 Tax=Photobacterium rosenbergii TaxID=294936 RepID=A0ABU3ZG64_9GAMM|nr:helix-turn-helix transcriptional regulator [Photobacterium rosenbergii]MDV5169100.1 helix-turn-helix transcriptional regulator [Photobacterium rosenbergii]
MQIPTISFNHKKSNQAELEIFDLESLYQRENLDHSPHKPHRITFFMMVYIEHGAGEHMVDFKSYPYHSGSIVFVRREQVHAFDFSSKPKGKVIIFTQAFLDQLHANMRLPNYTPTYLNQSRSPVLTLDKNTGISATRIIEEVLKEISRDNVDPLIVMYLFSSFALMLHRLRPEERHDKLSQEQSVKLARFFDLLQVHYEHVRDANWFASQIGTTYKTLNQICKLATDLTAKQMIDAFVTIEMKRRLVVSNATTQQLAYDFGFEDASNFVKYFKNQTEMTPSQFQKQYADPQL